MLLQSRWLIDKTEVTARDGLVVSKDVLASRAGIEMLRAGGNAVDAAVAAAFTVGVVEPWMNGIGGGGFMVIHLARENRTLVIDYAMRGPRRADENLFELEDGYSTDLFGWRKVKDDANIHGWKSIAVPGAVAGLCHAQQAYGRLSLQQVMAPAIRCAREGFPVTWYTQLQISADAQLISRYPETARYFFDAGMPKVALYDGANKVVQEDLARTLEAIAAEGPDIFYRGAIARRMAAAMAENGGLITEEDLASYRVRVVDPAPAVKFGRFDLFTSPCPSGGTTLQEIGAILDGSGIEETGHNSADALHLIAEASRLAWADRFGHLCDPDLMRFPWQALYADAYAAERRSLIDRRRAMEAAAPGNPAAFGPAAGRSGPDGSTTALVAADSDHNMVSITQTLMASFGSRVTVPGTGILMNNGMYWFDPEPGKPNSVGPGKKPLNNMAPLLVMRDGKPFLAISSSGGRKIVGANLNLFLNAANFRMSMQEAVSAPRIDLSAGYIEADDRIAPETLEALKLKGHKVIVTTESFHPHRFASPTCLRIDPESGLLTSGTDPLHVAAALGL